jgi:hypothetical protein
MSQTAFIHAQKHTALCSENYSTRLQLQQALLTYTKKRPDFFPLLSHVHRDDVYNG